MDINTYITTKEAAAIIGCGYEWIVDRCQAGTIPGAVKFGNSWAIPRTWAQEQPSPRRGPKNKKHSVLTLEDARPQRYAYQDKKVKKQKIRDLTGKVFGSWTVLGLAGRRNNRTFWHCRCICGAERDVNGVNLVNGTSRSCGCQKKAGGKTLIQPGDVFSRLTVIERTPTPGGKKGVYWHCRCECGNEVDVWAGCLTSGRTKSCGCLRREKARETVTRRKRG